MSRQDYQFFNLTQDQLDDITKIEEQINNDTNEKVILLAYYKQ